MTNVHAPINRSNLYLSLISSRFPKAVPLKIVTLVALGALTLLVYAAVRHFNRSIQAKPKGSNSILPEQPAQSSTATLATSSFINSSSSSSLSHSSPRQSITLESIFSTTTNLVYRHVLDTYRASYFEESFLILAFDILKSFKNKRPCRINDPLLDRDGNISLIPEFSSITVKGRSIHASLVTLTTGAFIATQAPFMITSKDQHDQIGTLSEREMLFWHCLSEHNVSAVINLERYSGYAATPIYTKNRKSVEVTDVFIEYQDQSEEFSASKHHIIRPDQTPYEYTYVNYIQWVEKKHLPPNALNRLVEYATHIRTKQPDKPILVHSRLGFGRTGIFIIACALSEIAKNGLLTNDNYRKVILTLIFSFKTQRSLEHLMFQDEIRTLTDYAEYLLNGSDEEHN